MYTEEQLKAENKKLLEDREILLKKSVETITEIEELEKKLTIAVSLLKTETTEMKNLREGRIYNSRVKDFLNQIKGDEDEIIN